MKRLLCVWFPNWAIQRWRRELLSAGTARSAQAFVLYRQSRRGDHVVACCTRAWQRGVRPGMPLGEAKALQRAACHWQVAKPAVDRAELARLARECEAFSPLVDLVQEEPPETLCLEVTGVAERWGGELVLARQLARTFHRGGYQLHLGLADSVGGAWALAHFGHESALTPVTDDTVSGHAQAALACPIYFAAPGQTRVTLATLPIESLRLPAATVATLHELGIQHIEQLWRLPRGGLATRLGAELLRRLDQAGGDCPEVLRGQPVVEPLQATWQAEIPTSRREEVQQVLTHLSCHLSELLAARQQGALELKCHLELVEQPALTVTVGLFQPSTQADHWCRLLQVQLESLHLPAPVEAVRLTATATSAQRPRQRLLWCEGETTESGADTAALAELVERLTCRLGPEQVRKVQLRAGKLPEQTWVTHGWTGLATRSRDSGETRDPAVLLPGQRPLYLCPRPVPISVRGSLAAAPSLAGLPSEFRHDNTWYVIARSWGPERIETDWWRGRCARRDYYRVDSVDGRRWWLFYELTARRWFLHGWFS